MTDTKKEIIDLDLEGQSALIVHQVEKNGNVRLEVTVLDGTGCPGMDCHLSVHQVVKLERALADWLNQIVPKLGFG